MTSYHHVPHPRTQQRKVEGPSRTIDQRRLHHPNPLVRFNARLALGTPLWSALCGARAGRPCDELYGKPPRHPSRSPRWT